MIIFIFSFSLNHLWSQAILIHDKPINELIVNDWGEIWIQDFRGDFFKLDEIQLVKTNWGGNGYKVWPIQNNYKFISKMNKLFKIDKDELSLVDTFKNEIVYASILNGEICVLDSEHFHYMQGDDYQQCIYTSEDNQNRILSINQLRDKKYLVNETQLVELCEEFHFYFRAPFKIKSAVPYGSAILLASEDQGLWTFQNDRFRKYFIPGVVFPDQIEKLLIDDKQLWLLTKTKDLYRYQIENQIISSVASNVENFVTDYWNTIWYISGNKLIRNSDYSNDHLVKLKLTKIEANYLEKEISEDLALTKNENNIAINFRGFYTPDPSGIEYYYRINSTDSWINNGKNQSILLNNCKPGKHHIEIKATADGQYFSEIKHISFSISSGFFDSYWPYLFAALLVLLLTAFIANKSRQAQNLRLREEKDKLRLQLELLRNQQKLGQLQLNPHFLFNSLNSISGLIALNEKKDARKYLTEISQMMRSVLNQSFGDNISLKDEINFLEKYLHLEQLIRDNKFDYSINSKIDGEKFLPIMMIQPFVENAILHGIKHLDRKGLIQIDFQIQGNYFLVTIRDDGIGREATKEFRKEGHSSTAINIIRKRLSDIDRFSSKGHINYEDLFDLEGNPQGTIVSLYIPIMKSKNG